MPFSIGSNGVFLNNTFQRNRQHRSRNNGGSPTARAPVADALTLALLTNEERRLSTLSCAKQANSQQRLPTQGWQRCGTNNASTCNLFLFQFGFQSRSECPIRASLFATIPQQKWRVIQSFVSLQFFEMLLLGKRALNSDSVDRLACWSDLIPTAAWRILLY
jgi:hypothetical protein